MPWRMKVVLLMHVFGPAFFGDLGTHWALGCGCPWIYMWPTSTVNKSTSKPIITGMLNQKNSHHFHKGLCDPGKERPYRCDRYEYNGRGRGWWIEGASQIPLVSIWKVLYPVLWHIQRHWVMGHCWRTQGSQGDGCMVARGLNLQGMMDIEAVHTSGSIISLLIASTAECFITHVYACSPQKIQKWPALITEGWHYEWQRPCVYLKPVARRDGMMWMLAVATLQAWRPCSGFGCFLRSAVRCLSSQQLQSSSKCWQVSSLGRVRSTFGVISRGTLTPEGYCAVRIGRKTWPVHRVVKLTHDGCPPSPEAWQVHHRDGNKANNALNNLEYVTAAQNQLYSHATGVRRDSWHTQSRPVVWRVIGGHEWSHSCSIAAAAKQLGISAGTVSRSCCTSSPAGGYEFHFRDLEEAELDEEEWRPMLNPNSGVQMPGRFVSSYGRIKSLHGHVTRGHLSVSGYYETKLLKQTTRVHRLVALAFLGPPPSSAQSLVNHKDFNKGNNSVENLEYVTPAENSAHFFLSMGFKRTAGVKPVCSRVCGSTGLWTLHDSISSAGRTLAVNTGSISQCASGKMKQAGGYEFRLADSIEHTEETWLGEIWRDVDISVLLQDRDSRRQKSTSGLYIYNIYYILYIIYIYINIAFLHFVMPM